MNMPIMRLPLLVVLMAGLTGGARAEQAPPSAVKVEVDYPAFLVRQDLVFEKLPDQFDTGAFLGNGMLGATIYQTGPNTLRWEMGRADVTEHRRDNNRLPIGGLVLTTVGKIDSGTMRIDLWNAEVRGEVKTDQGMLRFRSFIHTKEMALFIDLETEGAESPARFAWDATICRDFVNWPDPNKNGFWNEPPNPPARLATVDGIPVCVQELWKLDDAAGVSHTTELEGLRGNGSRAPGEYINPADFTWAPHDYWQHYRCTMDHSMVTDHEKHAFYPLLRGDINVYLNLLKEGGDGKLHLPSMLSPEYAPDVDNNYQLSLLRWGCQTLLDLNRRYQLNDPLVPKWRQALDKLPPYAVDETGLRIGPNVQLHSSHRHWSHMLMIHPLHLLTGERPEDRDLIKRSITHWLTVGDAGQVFGWSRAAAASLYATIGDGDNAIDQIHRHMADQRFVRPNTMYLEGDPVIECSIVLNRSVQDMLLQSWGNGIHVFPAVLTTDPRVTPVVAPVATSIVNPWGVKEPTTKHLP